jgi:hypothetical protein
VVVIEVKSSNKSHRFERVADLPLTIGRALDNDIIVDDPYVDPHHLRIEADSDDNWIAIDLDSTNHTINSNTRIDVTPINSGDLLTIGKTHIRVFREDHKVSATLSTQDLEHRILEFGTLKLVVLLTSVLVMAVSLTIFLQSTIDTTKPYLYAIQTMRVLGSIAVMSGVWAVISRILKGEARITALLSLTIVQMLAGIVLGIIINTVYYNLPGAPLKGLLNSLISSTLLVIYIYLCLVITTRLHFRAILLVCTLIITGSLGFFGLRAFSEQDRFINLPQYDGVIYAPGLLLRSGRSESEFHSNLPALFARADALVDKTE